MTVRTRSALKSWVFKSFLKVERDAPALAVLGSSFHQRGTTNTNLNLMRAATGSQWSSMSSGVTCALFGWLNTRHAAAFWIICSGFTTLAGRPVRRALQSSRRGLTKVCTSSWVAYWVRYGLILRMLYSAKRHDLETEAMWAVKVSWSSIMTPRFLAVLYGTRDKESILMLMLWWMACFS